MAKQIPLRARDGTVRAYAVVDDEDFARLGHLRWHLMGEGYAARDVGRRKLYLHREVVDGAEVDHKDGNKLDCRRSNLRSVTRKQNAQNTGPRSDNTSGYRGVTWNKRKGRWQVQCKVDGRLKFGGYFDDVDEAGNAAVELRAEHMTHCEER